MIDVKNCAGDDFSALDFVMWCASEGSVEVDGRSLTVLTAPMAGFYSVPEGAPNPGRTQMRVAYVVPPDRMAVVPDIFARLLQRYVVETRAGVS